MNALMAHVNVDSATELVMDYLDAYVMSYEKAKMERFIRRNIKRVIDLDDAFKCIRSSNRWQDIKNELESCFMDTV